MLESTKQRNWKRSSLLAVSPSSGDRIASHEQRSDISVFHGHSSKNKKPLSESDLSIVTMGFGASDAAVLLLNDNGQFLFANKQATELLREDESITIDASGIVRCRNRTAQSRLCEFISNTATHPFRMARAETLFLPIPRREGWPIAAQVRRYSPHFGELDDTTIMRKNWIVILIRDPEHQQDDYAERIASLFGLSWAEAQVVTRLIAGVSPEDIASERRVSLVTVRNQLKSAQSKIGVTRQAELVSLLLRTIQF